MLSFPQFSSAAEGASSMVMRMGSDGYLYDNPNDVDIHSLLDSKFDAEKSEGLKRLLALLAQGSDVSNFFPQVVKNVASTSLEVKKLVYIYLVHYAERRPDEALLSINSFQKDLSDLNPLVRAWALRAMSGIRIDVVQPLVSLAVSKCARDPSPYVRRCAANAIPKLYNFNQEDHDKSLQELIGILLNDTCVGVVGAAAAAFKAICPDNLALIGANFRRLCEALPDAEEWGQIILIEILLRYISAKHGIPTTSVAFKSGYVQMLNNEIKISDNTFSSGKDKVALDVQDFEKENNNNLENLPSVVSESSDSSETDNDCAMNNVHEDSKLLLLCTSPLLWSQNSAVVLAAAGVHWFLAAVPDVEVIVKPLLFLLRSSYDSQYVVLANLSTFVRAAPYLFEQYFEDFFVRSSDSNRIRAIKLKILSTIATESSVHAILQEFEDYVRHPDRQFAADAVAAIGQCAKRISSTAQTCLKGLLSVIRHSSKSLKGNSVEKMAETGEEKKFRAKSDFVFHKDQVLSDVIFDGEAAVLTQAISAVKTVLQNNLPEFEKVFVQLIQSLQLIKVPTARAVVIWMIGEYCTAGVMVPKILSTVMKYLASSFVNEGLEAKIQILNCSAKVVMRYEGDNQHITNLAAKYILDLGCSDLNYDICDSARMLKILLQSQIKIGENDISRNFENEMPGTTLSDSSNTIIKEIHNLRTMSNQKECVHASISILNHILLSPRTGALLKSVTTERVFLPGSLSHIVQHKAPGYRSLPKAHSLCEKSAHDLFRSNASDNTGNESDEMDDDSYSSSEVSSIDESLKESDGNGTDSSYIKSRFGKTSAVSKVASDQKSNVIQSDFDLEGEKHISVIDRRSQKDKTSITQPLIHLSDGENEKQNLDIHDPFVASESLLMTRKDVLESWLETDIPTAKPTVEESSISGCADLSIGEVDVVPRKYTLLNYTNGNGLNIMYAYSKESSAHSASTLCINLYFKNHSMERLSNIVIRSNESITLLQMEQESSGKADTQGEISSESLEAISKQEISSLEPGQTLESQILVHFDRLMMPFKMYVECESKHYSVLLKPEIGVLLRPLPLSTTRFISMESHMTGMLENSRRCSFAYTQIQNFHHENDDRLLPSARSIVSKVLSTFCLSLVSVTMPVSTSLTESSSGNDDISGLCLRFSGEILSSSSPCLVTVTADGSFEGHELPIAVKVNCDDPVFGLNILKRLIEVLTERLA